MFLAVGVGAQMACASFYPEGRVSYAISSVLSVVVVVINHLGDSSLLSIRAFRGVAELSRSHFTCGCRPEGDVVLIRHVLCIHPVEINISHGVCREPRGVRVQVEGLRFDHRRTTVRDEGDP